MTSQAASKRRGDGRLWAAALGLSLVCDAAILLLAGFAVIESKKFQHPKVPATQAAETVRIIVPELIAPTPDSAATTATDAKTAEEALAPTRAPDFSRTAEDQRGKRPDRPAFIGERDTEATSDATPDPNAQPMPAQAGIQPRHAGDIETTESRYQDGHLSAVAAGMPEPPTPPSPPTLLAPEPPSAEPTSAQRGETTQAPVAKEESSPPPEPSHLAQGPNPVEVPMPEKTSAENRKTESESLPKEGKPDATTGTDVLTQSQPKTSPKETPKQPAFRGYQRKTAIQGSISRTGRSALDVEDSPLGRYHATISRAVELEWQRNCMRYRDRITPGFLTVRFFVNSKGKVRNIQSVGPMQSGQIQKGFTFNSIHDAAIPAMPRELGKDYQEDPLEISFTFYF